VAWNIFGPVPETTTGSIELGLAKTLTYRVVSTSRNLVLAYAFTGNAWTAVGYAAINNVTDALIYIANEYGWTVYGPPMPAAVDAGAAIR
jgi:uncharacterized membrane protein